MSSLRLRPTRIVLTISPVSRLTRWTRARRRAATQSAVGLAASDPIPYGYSTLASVCAGLRVELEERVRRAAAGDERDPDARPWTTATALGGSGTVIGCPRGRPVR